MGMGIPIPMHTSTSDLHSSPVT